MSNVHANTHCDPVVINPRINCADNDAFHIALSILIRQFVTCDRDQLMIFSRKSLQTRGKLTPEVLFANAPLDVLDLARRYVDLLYSLGDVQVIPQKTRLVCVARVRFAGLYPRKTASGLASRSGAV